MKNLTLTILILFSSLLLYGCACTSAKQNTISLTSEKKTQIPAGIIQKGNEVISSRTGDDFFEKFIKFNSVKSIEIPEGYYLAYSFTMSGKDYIDEEISFILDKQGILKPGFDIAGIPECNSDTSKCQFNITREMAVDIAGKADLQQGIREWSVSFEWDSKLGKYIWLISSTLSESTGSQGKKGKGEKLLIDANSGEVISKTEWKVF